MTTVLAPNPSYSGVTAGVRFVDGRADTDDGRALARLRRAGYRIVTDVASGDELRAAYTPGPEASATVGSDGGEPGGAEPKPVELPAGNASHAAWAAHAVAQGLDQATAEAMTRDELRAAYTPGPEAD